MGIAVGCVLGAICACATLLIFALGAIIGYFLRGNPEYDLSLPLPAEPF